MNYLVAYMGVAFACALAGIGSAVGVGIAAQASTGVMSVDRSFHSFTFQQ